MYELQGILVHKGVSAGHGHYVAHIKLDEAGGGEAPKGDAAAAAVGDGKGGSTSGWWRFDDEAVTAMARGPLSSPSDHGIAGAAAGAGGKKGAGRKGGKKDALGDDGSDPDFDMEETSNGRRRAAPNEQRQQQRNAKGRRGDQNKAVPNREGRESMRRYKAALPQLARL